MKSSENANNQTQSQTRTAADNTAQRKDGRDGALEFVDNRTDAVAQQQRAGMMQNSPYHAATGRNANTMETAQRQELGEEEAPAQMMAEPVQRVENKTGMPDNLKSGLENISGMSMDHVRVHYNSSKPAQLNAHAYTQGSDIHVAPGQEKHLPHEGWHVVQQAQGRVKPTMQMAGTQINDDVGLETEADVMGSKATSIGQRVAQRASADAVNNNGSGSTVKINSVQLHKFENNSPAWQSVVQAHGLSDLASGLGIDISYSIVPEQKDTSNNPQAGSADVTQRLVVVDDDMDTSRLTSAVAIYKKRQGTERITTIHKAKHVQLNKGEKVYMVAHGDGEKHGGRSAKELAAILQEWGLHPGSSVIKLISCFSGKDAPDWSYANELALQLDFKYKTVGIKGLESTDDKGHTRATEQLVSDDIFGSAYFGALGNDESFQQAEKLVAAVKPKVFSCDLGEEAPLMLEVYQRIVELCQHLDAKIEKALDGMIRDKSKEESEDVMTPLPQDE